MDVENGDGRTALQEACSEGHLPVAQLLIESGARIDHQDNDGDTPLHDASYNGHLQVVRAGWRTVGFHTHVHTHARRCRHADADTHTRTCTRARD